MSLIGRILPGKLQDLLPKLSSPVLQISPISSLTFKNGCKHRMGKLNEAIRLKG